MNPTQSLPYLPLSKSLSGPQLAARSAAGAFGQFSGGATGPGEPPLTLYPGAHHRPDPGGAAGGGPAGQPAGLLGDGSVFARGPGAAGVCWRGHLVPPAHRLYRGLSLVLPLAAYLVGYLVERYGTDRSVLKTFGAMLLASLLIYAIGVTWLGFALAGAGKYAGVWGVLQAGMIPFIPGDAIKAGIAAALLPTAWRLVRR